VKAHLLVVVLAAVLASCADASGDPLEAADLPADEQPLPEPPPFREGALAPEVEDYLDELLSEVSFLGRGDIPALGRSGDVRVAWPLVDLLRFHEGGPADDKLRPALAELTGVHVDEDEIAWVAYSDLLLHWDVPAPPGYFDLKRRIHVSFEPGWAPFFVADSDLDWREVTWGGVRRDGIAALVDPPAVSADDADWMRDDEIVFGLAVGGEVRAYPRRILAVNELVNDTLGDRRVALSYCTLCGSPIPHDVTEVADVGELELRTSGLLRRSNKLMFDTQTESLFDQIRGLAVSGPLRGVELEPLSLVVTTWEEWREANPGTTVLEIPETRGPLDGPYEAEPGRRGDPIFPVGDTDDRLPAMELVYAVVTPQGAAVAFPLDAAQEHLQTSAIVFGGVALESDSGGIVARPADGGPELPGHVAYWFAWSQVRPDTALWE
jgi:hypothetical protein